MKKLIKRLSSAVILAILMRPGIDAAPQKAASTKRDASSVDDEASAKTIQIPLPIPTANHIDDLKGPGYDVHVHDYHPPPHPPAPQIYKDSVVELLQYLEKTFHFIDVVDKNDLLATDLVDESWYEWLDYLQQVMPILNRHKVHASEIKNPQHEEPLSLWDGLLHMFLKTTHIVDVDKEKPVDNSHVQYTSISFDPVGQLVDKSWNLIKEYSGYTSLTQWWKRLQYEFQKYTAFKHDKLTGEEVKAEEVDDGVHLPEGVLTISAYDPVVLGVNTILFFGWQALFWASYLPVSGLDNLLEDYPDIDPDDYDNGESSDDLPPEEDGPPADGGDGGDGRRDYYEYYNYYDYDYYDRKDPGHGSVARTHVGESRKDSLSSNYYSHGAVPPEEAYTLSDGNIYVKKK